MEKKNKSIEGVEQKGITLIVLVLTIIIMLIIAGISIFGTITVKDEAEESIQISALEMVHHAVLERYTKSQLTKEDLPGTLITLSEVQEIIKEINSNTGENITLKGTEYYELAQEDLEELGIAGDENIFIVNYSTGEVINKTLKATKSGKALYTYSKESE